MVGFLKDILEDHSIPCLIKNEHLVGAAGELPPLECWPELWVTQDEDLDAAMRLVEVALKEVSAALHPWMCRGCGELIEAQFSACWKCGKTRSDS